MRVNVHELIPALALVTVHGILYRSNYYCSTEIISAGWITKALYGGPFPVVVTAFKETEDILVVRSDHGFDTSLCRLITYKPTDEQTEAYFRDFQKLREAYKISKVKGKFPKTNSSVRELNELVRRDRFILG